MAKYCIGIDLGGTFIKFGLLDGDGKATGIFQLPTSADDGPDAVINRMIEGSRQLMSDNRVNPADVLGVGIGAPGPLDISGGIVRDMPNLKGFKDVPIRDAVSDGLNLPAVLENDANAAALGEYIAADDPSVSDLVMLTLGTGIGSGIIINGKILHGAHEIGGEFGHMIVEPDGEPCNCGQRGCLERYCSATYIARHAERMIKEGRDSSLKATLEEKGELDARDINEARRAGDTLAAEVWDRGTFFLALACVNISRIFDPDQILLAGGMTRAGDDLMKPLMAHFDRMHWKITDVMTHISIARMGHDAGVIGAAGVARQHFADVNQQVG